MSIVISNRLFTPEDAKRMLERNIDGNRRVKDYVVAKYAKDMREGRWKDDVSGQIIVSDTGKLLDGQHRLIAVMLSGIPRAFDVKTGVPESAFAYIDNGSSRTVADFIGIPNANEAAAIARVMQSVDIGKSIKASMASAGFTRNETLDYARSRIDEIGSITRTALRMRRSVGRGSGAAFGCFVYLAGLADDGERDRFCNDFVNDDPTIQPVRAAKNRLLILFAKSSERIPKHVIVGTLLYAFDAMRDGREIKQFNKVSSAIAAYEGFISERAAS